jgi:hypothetical protein
MPVLIWYGIMIKKINMNLLTTSSALAALALIVFIVPLVAAIRGQKKGKRPNLLLVVCGVLIFILSLIQGCNNGRYESRMEGKVDSLISDSANMAKRIGELKSWIRDSTKNKCFDSLGRTYNVTVNKNGTITTRDVGNMTVNW